MGKYHELVNKIISNVGGKENIASVRHCVTRLRLNLVNDAMADADAVKNIDGVVTVVKSAGQFQVVIGNHVPDVYKEFLKETGLGTQTQVSQEGMSFGARAFDLVSGIMMPFIMTLSAAGIIKGIAAIVVVTGLVGPDSSTYIMLDSIGGAVMYFFPIFVGLTTARKLGVNEFLGLAIGSILVLPALNGVDLTFFGRTFNASYTETVLPAILVVALAAPVERFFNKIIPDVVKSFLVPTLVLLLVVPVGFLFIGPAANYIGTLISSMIQSLIGFSPMVAGFVSGGLWQLLVMLGVHVMVIIPSIMNLTSGIPDQFLGYITVVSFSQMAVVFAIWIKTKNKRLKDIALPAWISSIFGVTEPAIYGVTLPRVKYFIISSIGGALGGAVAGLFNVYIHGMTGLGVFALAGFLTTDGSADIKGILIAVAVAILFSFVVTYLMYKDEGEDLINQTIDKNKAGSNEKVLSPLNGTVMKLEDSSDEAFSSGALGVGVSIVPTDGKVYAPFSGVVTVLFPTLHAIGMISDLGTEVLIHVGIDTVGLNGKHFVAHIKQGDSVKQGDLLLEFDIEAIVTDGYRVETPVILTNTGDYLDVLPTDLGVVTTDDTIITALFK